MREACITVAYMSQELVHKMDHFCEMVLPVLINLIPNTAKVSLMNYLFIYVICNVYIVRHQ